MEVLRRDKVGFHIMGMVFCLQGPPKADGKFVLPTRGCMGAFVRDGKWSRREGPKIHHFPYSKFLDFAAECISPMPSVWIAVIGDRACAFRENGAWHLAISLAVTHELNSLAQGCGWEPAVTFIPGHNVQKEGVEFGTSEFPDDLRAYLVSRLGNDGVDNAANDSIRALLSSPARSPPRIPEIPQGNPPIDQVPHKGPARPFGLGSATSYGIPDFFNIDISSPEESDRSIDGNFDETDIINAQSSGDSVLAGKAARLMGIPSP